MNDSLSEVREAISYLDASDVHEMAVELMEIIDQLPRSTDLTFTDLVAEALSRFGSEYSEE